MLDSAGISVRRRGRPDITDHLQLYVYIEVGRRRHGLGVRDFIRRRDTRFGRVEIHPDGNSVTYLTGEGLRRRYSQARRVIELVNPHPHVQSDAYDECQAENRAFLDHVIEVFAD
jgi:hypothetical protein